MPHVAQVRFCEAESVILVGHSHHFRELIRQHMHEDCGLEGVKDPPSALKKKKLSNAGGEGGGWDQAGLRTRRIASVAW